MKCIGVGILLSASSLWAGVREFEFRFPRAYITFSKERGYDVVKMRGAYTAGEIGEPAYPVYAYSVALPPGAEIENLELVEFEKVEIPGKYKIYPNQPPIPFIKDYPKPEFVHLKEEILSQTTPYPAKTMLDAWTGTKGGFQIGAFRIAPLRYIPAEGKLELLGYVKVKVYYKEEPRNVIGFHERIIDNMTKPVKRMVINPEDVETYKMILKTAPRRQSKALPAGDYEYVIISRGDWQSAWQPLIDWKHKKGCRATFYSIEDVLTDYAGDNNQEKVKKFIEDAYNTWGALWFVLGADLNEISHAPCYGYVSTFPFSTTDNDIASTRFFEDLYKGTDYQDWDYDNDHIYCKLDSDGPGGTRVDLLADCYVGRVPVNSTTEIQNFVNRVLTYEKNPTLNYQNKVLFWTEQLFSAASPGRYHADQLETKLANADINYLSYTELYDEYDAYISDDNAVGKMNTGYNWNVVYSHGDYGEVMQGSNDDKDVTTADLNSIPLSIQDSKWGIHTGICCMSGGYHEVAESYSEYWLIDKEGGVASIFSSEYGWGYDVSDNDTSAQNYTLSVGLVFRFVFYSYDHNDLHIGEALANARDAHDRFVGTDDDAEKWCLIEYNLLGDPEMPTWRDSVKSLEVVYQDTVPLGSQTVEITVKDAGTGSVIESATVCIMTEIDTVYKVGTTNDFGIASFNITTSEDNDTLWITCTRYEDNYKPYAGYALVLDVGRPEKPTVYKLFNFAKVPDLQPTLTFSSTDPQNDDIEYKVYWDTDETFATPDSDVTIAYASGDTVNYTFATPLLHNETYWWKTKARDPLGSGYWSHASDVMSFSIDTLIPDNTCSWLQTTGEQFDNNTLTGVEIQGDSIVLGSSSGTDTLIKENFEAGIPSDWTVIDGGGDGYKWTAGTTSDLGDNEPPSYGTKYAYYSDDNAGNGNNTPGEYLKAPPKYIGNASSLKLVYGWGFRRYQVGEQMTTEVRFHNGTSWESWNTVATYSSSGSGTDNKDLTSYLPADSVQIQWHYDDEGASHWGWASAVDNVLLIKTYDISNTSGNMVGVPVFYKNLSETYPRNDWGYIIFTKSQASDSISIQIEFNASGVWALIPDGDLPGNSSGFFTSTAVGSINISTIDTLIYDSLSIVGLFYRPTTKAATDPSLLEWEIGTLGAEATAVKLVYFEALVSLDGVVISWRTESEIDTYEWWIERSIERDSNYERIAIIKGEGTSSKPREYSYVDKNVEEGETYYYRVIDVDQNGNQTIHGTVSVTVFWMIPKVFALRNAYPNPSSDETTIRYEIPQKSYVSLKVYDISGRLVKTLVNEEKIANYYTVRWDGKNENGREVGSGVYFYRLQAGNKTATKKLVLVR